MSPEDSYPIRNNYVFTPPPGMMWIAVCGEDVRPLTQFVQGHRLTLLVNDQEVTTEDGPALRDDLSRTSFGNDWRTETVPAQDIENLSVGVKAVWRDGLQIVDAPERIKAARAIQAMQLLASTDFVVSKASETGRALSSEWLEWRQHLRDIVNGIA